MSQFPVFQKHYTPNEHTLHTDELTRTTTIFIRILFFCPKPTTKFYTFSHVIFGLALKIILIRGKGHTEYGDRLEKQWDRWDNPGWIQLKNVYLNHSATRKFIIMI